MQISLPRNQETRLDAVRQYEIVDTFVEQSFDDLVHLAAHICGTSIALINLIGSDRQWFKAKVGVDVSEISQCAGFCTSVICQHDLLVVPDASRDPRFAAESIVTSEPYIRFYAGMPLVTPEGDVLGTLCVADLIPRQLSEEQADALRALARQAITQIELRCKLSEVTRTEKALRESEEWFRSLVQGSKDIITILGVDGTIRYKSLSVQEVLGYRPEELIGKNAFDFVHPDDMPTVMSTLAHEMQNLGVTQSAEYRFRHKDGSWRTLEATGRFESSGIQGFVLNSRDITDRKQMDQALQDSKERYRTITELISDVAYAIRIEPDGTPVTEWITGALMRITGYTLEELEARGGWLSIAYADDLPIVLRKGQMLLAGHADVSEFRILTKTGDVRWVRDMGKPELDPTQNRVVRILGAARDITERKQAEESLRESEERLRFAFDAANMGTWEWDATTNKSTWSDQLQRLHGLVPGTYGGTYEHFLASVHPDDREDIRQAVDRSVEDGVMYDIEFRIVRPDGSIRWMGRKGRVICDLTGRAIRMIGVAMDITERKQAEEALRESEERFRSLVQNSSDITTILDIDGTIRYESPSIERVLGYQPEELIGKNAFDFVHPGDLPHTINVFTEGLTTSGATLSTVYRFRHKDGSWRTLESTGRVECSTIQGVVINSRDITERKMVEDQLLHHAFYDTLTALPNRALLMDRLERAIERAKRHAGYLIAVLFLDLDRFKVINDSLGHAIGDQLLVAVARRLEACIRTEDTVARLGGDEFVILLDNIIDVNQATQVADRIQEILREPLELSGHEVSTTASIGIALSSGRYERAEDLLRDADIAMYRAKTLGKARHEVFNTTMHVRAMELLQLEADLRRAFERQEFELHYQPIVSLASGKIIGVEALLRWNHPQRGLVQPMEFISLTEEMGLIIPIGEWVLHTACAQMNTWHAAGLAHFWISVNLSARQFKHKNLSAMIAGVLEATGLDPRYLKLELTESSVMDNAEMTIATLKQLRALGVQISIDDFGTGYSSLAYLKRFPLDTLKIAQPFVADIATDSSDAAITTAIIAMAHSLRLGVIAEGVENPQQADFLSAYACDAIQGYLFSHPVTAETMMKLLEQGGGFLEDPSTE
jgi:diguanylate cyclase (GGDEF)-like protein/PAS domain S-box-containing protein